MIGRAVGLFYPLSQMGQWMKTVTWLVAITVIGTTLALLAALAILIAGQAVVTQLEAVLP